MKMGAFLQTFAMVLMLAAPAMAADVVIKKDPVIPGQLVVRKNGQPVAFIRPDVVIPGQYRVTRPDGTRITELRQDRVGSVRKETIGNGKRP